MPKTLPLLVFTFFLSTCFSQRLVLKGDYPDPSVIKVGDTYYASATSSNWFPAFPIFKSSDLVHWQQQGYVFNKLPEWADYYFWAPELSYDNGKVWVYYAAHKKGGNLCIGVASAESPLGPFKDLGPLVCEPDGSIDAFPQRDENGKLYLIWKEDANSINKPTSIWAEEMSESRTSLIGKKVELFRNDKPWEGNLVEGAAIMRHGNYFYAFFAGAGCCGANCNYAIGIARSVNLLGPWEKYNDNPVLKNINDWICSGHGTPIEKDGKFYFLHHAYDKNTIPFTGRQGILSSFTFTENNWIEFLHEKETFPPSNSEVHRDEFKGNKISDTWQWSIFQNPMLKINNGSLQLFAQPHATYIGQRVTDADYSSNVSINTSASDAAAGIGLIGDDKNYIALYYHNNKLQIVKVMAGKEEVIYNKFVPNSNKITLHVDVINSKNIFFHYSIGSNQVPLNNTAIDGNALPPWDRAVRIGLLSKGNKEQKSVFQHFQMRGVKTNRYYKKHL